MTYEEFEWHLLRLTYEDGVTRFHPVKLSYMLGLPHAAVSEYLDRALQSGVVEVEVNDDGRMEYKIPGVVPGEAMPRPLWKKEPGEDRAQVDVSVDGTDGAVGGDQPKPKRRLGPSQGRTPELPPMLQSYIKDRYGDADGSLTGAAPLGRGVVSIGASADVMPVKQIGATAQGGPPAGTSALVPYKGGANAGALLRIESNDDAFCDPSQTIFMRQLRVMGVHDEEALRDQIQRLFESFGYRMLTQSRDRMRFERGSVTFILALVPLFVLILPLFVYLFLYCIGRSTIQQEPLELDVQIRRNAAGGEGCYDIDLTFIGLHGVVLGAADQRVLSQEVDTLRDELRWALGGV
jgi:hypothetical protein